MHIAGQERALTAWVAITRRAVPVIGFAPRIYRWLYVRPIKRLHRALANIERQLDYMTEKPAIDEFQAQLAEIERAVSSLKVARPFEVDRHYLRIHVRVVREDVDRKAAAI